MEKNIFLVGVGGQGLQVAGKVLVRAADKLGYKATYSPRYGFEKRGGLSSCYLVISDREIGNPRKYLQDILFVVEPKVYDRFKDCVKTSGVLVVNESLALDVPEDSKKNFIKLPLYECCMELGNMKVISAVVTGAVVALLPDLFSDYSVVEGCLLASLKNKPLLLELNRKAFNKGIELINNKNEKAN